MTTHGAELRFKGRTGPAGNPAQVSEPGIVTMPDGRKVRVTLEIQVNGAWKKIDPNHFSDAHLKAIAGKCQEIYQTTMHAASQPKTLTVYFEQKNLAESWKSAILGKVSKRFKDEVVDLTFKKIEYKTAGSDKLEVFDVQTHEFSTKADAVKVNQLASSMREVSKAVFSNREGYIEQPKKIKPKREAEQSSEKLAPVKTDLNVEEAGSQENRCASLSLAKRELQKLTPEKIVEKYNLTPSLAQSIIKVNLNEAIRLISEALIEKAAHEITQNEDFRDPHITLQNRPCLAAIERALKEYQRSHTDVVIPVSPEEKVAAYASLMRQPNFMLDLPFFLALKQPFIIVRKDNQNSFKITEIGHLYTIPDTIENCNLDDVNIVYYNGTNHYQSVDTLSADQKTAMRQLLRNEINSQIEALITRLKVKNVQDDTKTKESADMVELLRLYPRAKREMINRFKKEHANRAAQIEALKETPDNQFAAALRAALQIQEIQVQAPRPSQANERSGEVRPKACSRNGNGNSCFVNTALQIILRIPALSNLFTGELQLRKDETKESFKLRQNVQLLGRKLLEQLSDSNINNVGENGGLRNFINAINEMVKAKESQKKPFDLVNMDDAWYLLETLDDYLSNGSPIMLNLTVPQLEPTKKESLEAHVKKYSRPVLVLGNTVDDRKGVQVPESFNVDGTTYQLQSVYNSGSHGTNGVGHATASVRTSRGNFIVINDMAPNEVVSKTKQQVLNDLNQPLGWRSAYYVKVQE